MHATVKTFIVLCLLLLASSCGENNNTLPKPAAQLAMDYGSPSYRPLTHSTCGYTMDVNTATRAIAASDCSMQIEYPSLDATVFLSYQPVKENLRQLLIDGQKLSYGHNRMADVIADYPFINPDKRAYGMMYEIEGNAASNAQFYVTDSLNHFLTAALYFDTEPNYDSIFPAVNYLRKDMVKMLETLEWE